jgi:hypothetical protein
LFPYFFLHFLFCLLFVRLKCQEKLAKSFSHCILRNILEWKLNVLAERIMNSQLDMQKSFIF